MSSAPRYQPEPVPLQQLESARMGNAVCSLPDYPAEIRAPAGTLAGVSGFQVHFSSLATVTPGDHLTALVAMNPAALHANLKDLERNGVLLINSDAFTVEECLKAGYAVNPLDDGSLKAFRVLPVSIDTLTREAVAKLALSPREADRCKNFFALGFICWLFDRATDPITKWVKAKFATNPAALEGNLKALKAGYKYGEQAEWPVRYHVPKAQLPAGEYRHLTGTEGLVLGLQAAARLANRPLVFAGTPMTPASELLQRLVEQPRPDVRAIQAEDESAAASMAIGAAFGGAIAATATSGSGLGQMSETIALATMTELPMVVIDVQRGGPSLGLPTKTEQADLLQAMFGRNGECPVPVLAANSPSDSFAVTVEAARIACKFMTPVMVLTDVFLISGSEPWRIPDSDELPAIEAPAFDDSAPFLPYARNQWLARPWETPGTPGREHRIGGLEKEDGTGAVSYDPLNHEKMIRLRAAKVAKIADDIPELVIDGPSTGDLLVIGWGSTFGAISTAATRARRRGVSVAHAHLRYLNPFPRNTAEVLKRFRRILVPELNGGQLQFLLRARFLIDVAGLPKVQGRPFLGVEIEEAIDRIVKAP
jgi:2-oxoglutarate ferredoxin oxidoreductase subunit alpha